jgi:hypothetical protein
MTDGSHEHSPDQELEQKTTALGIGPKSYRKYFRWMGVSAGIIVLATMIAAIAIPALTRSRMTQCDFGAAFVLRTLNTTQVAYSTTYPERGFAPDLATLGPGRDGKCRDASANHACLIDPVLGCTTGSSGEWCIREAFRYSIRGTCKKELCEDYVIVATPVAPDAERKNFCSVPDAVVRVQIGPPLNSPITLSECQSWQPL